MEESLPKESGPIFDEETYAQAMPYFKQAVRDAQAVGKTLVDLVEYWLRRYGNVILPYIERFRADLRAGRVTLEEEVEGGGEYVPNDGLKNLARRHWKTYRPQMYRKLEQAGDLEQLLEHHVEQAVDMMSHLGQRGMSAQESYNLALQEWILLPSEDDVPVLGERPDEEEPPLKESMDMTFDDFVRAYRSTLLGYHLLQEWLPGRFHIESPYPPAELSDGELEELIQRLNDCMPRQSCIMDLWDWDVHFEDDLSYDWYFEAAFGSTDSLPHCARELEEFFLEQVEQYGLDYHQHEDPEFFTAFVRDGTQKFIQQWRDNIYKRWAQPTEGGDD